MSHVKQQWDKSNVKFSLYGDLSFTLRPCTLYSMVTDPDRGFFLLSEEKNKKNKNLLAGCRREITFRGELRKAIPALHERNGVNATGGQTHMQKHYHPLLWFHV